MKVLGAFSAAVIANTLLDVTLATTDMLRITKSVSSNQIYKFYSAFFLGGGAERGGKQIERMCQSVRDNCILISQFIKETVRKVGEVNALLSKLLESWVRALIESCPLFQHAVAEFLDLQ